MAETLHRFLDIVAWITLVVSGLQGIVTYNAERNYPGSPRWMVDQLYSRERVFHWRSRFVFFLLAAGWLAASYSTGGGL